MIRLASLSFLVLAGCSAGSSGPVDLRADYAQALHDGDRDRALDVLDAAADAGDLGALRELAEVRSQGYLSVPYDQGGGGRLTVASLPGEAMWTAWRYRRARDRGAEAGDPEALLAVAEEQAGDLVMRGGVRVRTLSGSRRDSVAVLYRRLLETNVSRLRLARLARHLDDEEAYIQLVDAAVAGREPDACSYKLYLTGTRRDLSTPAGLARFVDDAEACPRVPGDADHAAEQIGALVAQVRSGNDGARVLLDSLRVEGVFERHPRLAEQIDAPATERG